MISLHFEGGVEGAELERFCFGGVVLGAFGVEFVEVVALFVDPNISPYSRIPIRCFLIMLLLPLLLIPLLLQFQFLPSLRPHSRIIDTGRPTAIVHIFVFYGLSDLFYYVDAELILIDMLLLQAQFH